MEEYLIPVQCDVCGSSVIKGSEGETIYLCTNKKCYKSDASWPVHGIKAELDALNAELETLKMVSSSVGNIEIVTYHYTGVPEYGHTAGYILIKGKKINYARLENDIQFFTDNESDFQLLSAYRIKENVMRMWNLLFKIKTLLGKL